MTDALILAGGFTALTAYGLYVEPRRFQLSRHELHLPRWPTPLDGFAILHLSDLHTRGEGPVERWLARLRLSLPRPDLIAVTGDLAESRAALEACLAALAPWPSRHGTYAVLGNNDTQSYWQRRTVAAGLAEAGVTVLCDQGVEIDQAGARFRLAGLRYVSARHAPRAFRFPVEVAGDASLPRLLLAHSPDTIVEAAAAGIDLMLAGHTHGGQICLPFGRPLRNNLQRFRPPLFTRGVHRVDDTVLVVSRGLGMTSPPLRTWCRPEAAWLTLRSGDRQQG